MDLEFVIPLRPEELMREGNQYYVISADRISNGERPENVIDDVAQRLANTDDEREGPLSIVEHENFDSLYYAMLHLGEMSADEKTHLMDVLCKGLRAVSKATIAMFRREDAAKGKRARNAGARSSQQSREEDMDVDVNGGAADPQTWKMELFRYRTAIKMYFWLLQWFIGLEEQTLVQKNASATIVTSAQPGARGKKKQKTSDETQSPWESEDDRIKVFVLAADVLQVDLARLWGLANPDETFLALFSKIAFSLLENPVNHKSKAMRQALFEVVRVAVIKYNQGSECGNLMMEAMRRSEPMVPHMVDLVDTIISDSHHKKAKDEEEEVDQDEEGPGALVPGGGATFLGDLLRDIGNLSYKELATNNTAAKAFAAFVSSVADRFPKQVLPHISLLMAHLEGEAANMRSGIMEAIGYLIHKAFATFANHADQAGEFERIKASLRVRDSLLDVLLQRIRDTTSYTRGRVLQTWAYLAENQAITKAFWQQVTAEAVGRLHDKAALVRKCAIQLLSTMLINNPFGSDLKLSQFRTQYAEAKHLAEQRAGNELSIDRLVDIVSNNDEAAIAELNIQPEVIKIVNAFMMYRDGIHFIESMHEAMPMVSTLLGSKNVSDVHEAIRFFVRAHDFHLENAKEGVRKMILLVASSQIEVKQAVIEAFSNLYMTPPPHLSEDLHPLWVAKNLISWTLDASLGELTSLEELLGAMMAQHLISSEIVQTLWEIFMQKTATIPKAAEKAAAELAQQMQAAEGRGAIIILSMLASTDTSIIRNHLSDVVAVGLGPRAYNDPVLAKWACIALQKLAATPPPQAVNKDGTNAAPAPISPRGDKKGKKKAPAKGRRKKRGDDSDDEEDFEDSEDEKAKKAKADSAAVVATTSGGNITFEHTRYESTHKLFKKLTDLVETDRIPTSKWFGAAEQAINAIYLLAETPDKLMTEVIKRLAAPLFPRMFPTYYSKVAKQVKEKRERIQQLVNQSNEAMDVDDENGEAPQVPQMNNSKVDHAATDIGQLARLLFVLGHTAMKQLVYIDAIVRHVKIRSEAKEKKKAAAAARRPAAGRKSMGGDDEPEAIEKELGVTAADAEDEQMRRRAEDAVVCDNLVGSFSKVVVSVCADAVKFNDPYVRFAAVNALCKYMLVSERFCEENLQLLFSILQGPDPASLRASIAIALGDLNVRFPNKIELWRDHFYGRLSDPDVTVRKNTLMVLTHLILHDMIKPKEHISAMAMCLEDKEQRISDLARLFFLELASKENASAIYNIIPGMIGGLAQVTNLPFESVQNIVRYLFSFIQKEKHLESLIDKLCQRFVLSDTKQCEYVAYCLSCLPNWSDRSVKRLAELFNKYKEALNTPVVLDHFQSILAKARKNAKADMKTVIDELEVKINDAVDPEKIDQARAAAAAEAAARGEAGADDDYEAPKKGRGRAKRGAAKRAGAKRAGRGGKAGRGRGRGRRAFEDEEEDDDDLMEDTEDEEEEIIERAKSAPRAAKKAGAKKPTRVQQVSDDEDDSPVSEDGSEDEAPAPKKAAAKRGGAAKKAATKPRAKKQASSDDDDDDEDDGVMDLDDEPPAKAPSRPRAAAPRKKQIIDDSEDEDDDDD